MEWLAVLGYVIVATGILWLIFSNIVG
ncbi:hypothetical protein [Escherichia phage DK-13]|nr:hypothetical protein [Escherichia phage DK-13]